MLCQAADSAEAGCDRWCAAQIWLGYAAITSADMAAALRHFTAVRDAIGDQGPSRALADCLAGRSWPLLTQGRIAEAAEDARRSLAAARELGYPAGQARGLRMLGLIAYNADGDLGSAERLARQAEQITQTAACIPGSLARAVGSLLTLTLTAAGDLAAAEPRCRAGLARARDAGDLPNQVRMLRHLVILDLQAGRTGDAAAHLREQLQIAWRTGAQADMDNGLDCCALLCAATRRPAEALTLWAAAKFAGDLLHPGGDAPPDADHRRGPLRDARRTLGPARTRTAEDRGTAMSLATAAEYALMLTAPGPQQPQAATPGPEVLTARERELVTLVAQGRNDAQIADQLHISVRTVGSHLDRIRDKTGCRRRVDLTRLALSAGLV